MAISPKSYTTLLQFKNGLQGDKVFAGLSSDGQNSIVISALQEYASKVNGLGKTYYQASTITGQTVVGLGNYGYTKYIRFRCQNRVITVEESNGWTAVPTCANPAGNDIVVVSSASEFIEAMKIDSTNESYSYIIPTDLVAGQLTLHFDDISTADFRFWIIIF